MLTLLNIKKDYVLKDQEPVHALKGISLTFRSNEFVAILGPSGCGKTTLLNITGGLDHYDDGDLIIKGKSTKNFSDADWDTYRNHSIGFVFQTYNLIPHQTILKNVELALTISGVSKEERTRRAKEALDKVGLKGLYRKKPNQMSGGQMQRVAIARALVNNPEIVLADEPTGALDSETSIQIMDLLQEVAKDHLIIMVTHNPELATKYANRIVKMKDGEILDDSNPFDGKDEEVVSKETEQPVPEVNKGKKKHSSMSFFTAFTLSLSNLFSKLRRTILVALAGSIGIIGVSTILGVSCGVNNFIDDMQEDMLSAYPIQVAEESMDFTNLLTGLTNEDKKQIAKFDLKTQVGMDSLLAFLLSKYTDFTNIKTNDINENLVKFITQMPKAYYSAMNLDYSIDPSNNIFTAFKVFDDDKLQELIDEGKVAEDFVNERQLSINGLTQRYISTLEDSDIGFDKFKQFSDLFMKFMNQMPGEKNYIMSQYDFVGSNSRFPEAENELCLVVDKDQTLTDLILGQMGYYSEESFLNIAKKAFQANQLKEQYNKGEIDKETYESLLKDLDEKYQYNGYMDISDLLGHEFYYFPHQTLFQKNPTFVSHKQITMNLSGTTPSSGQYYLALTYSPESDSLLGNAIQVEDGVATFSNMAGMRMGSRPSSTDVSELNGSWALVPIEGLSGISGSYADLMSKALLLNVSSSDPQEIEERTVEFSATGSLSKLGFPPTPVATFDTGKIKEIEPETPDYWYDAYLTQDMIDNYDSDTYKGMKMKVVGVLKPKESVRFGTLSRGVYFSKAFAEKYMSDARNSELIDKFEEHIVEKRFELSSFNLYVKYNYRPRHEAQPDYEQDDYASALNTSFATSLSNLFFSFVGGGNDLDTEKEHLRAISGYKIVESEDTEHEGEVDYSIEKLPMSISIYPKDFNRKDNVISYLKKWNSNKTIYIDDQPLEAKDRAELYYTDTISMIVELISTLVTTISIALIAFTSLSLVVSCFMIAVITYISVMERVKEIGVIRSLGGRKRDVSTLFISENLITGLASGIIGILVTYLLQIIINAIVSPFGVSNIAALPILYALLMIGLSVFLSVISGLIPSFSASKQDPVVALRTE